MTPRTRREVVPISRQEAIAQPDRAAGEVVVDTSKAMEDLATQMIEISRICASIMVDPRGEHPQALALDPRLFSVSPRATKAMIRFFASPDSYGKVLGLSKVLLQPVSKLVRSLEVIVREGTSAKPEDSHVSVTAKRVYARVLGVPLELLDLAGDDGIPQIRFYLCLADWWAQQVINAQTSFEKAKSALEKQERLMGVSVSTAEKYNDIYQQMEAARVATKKRIEEDNDKATSRDVVASVGSGSEGSMKEVAAAAEALRNNLRLYEQFDKQSLKALRAQLEVGRQERNSPDAQRVLDHLRRVVEIKLKQLFLCVTGLDTPLRELEGILVAGMVDVADAQHKVLAGCVDLQNGLVAAAYDEFRNTNQVFEQQLLNSGGDVVDGEFTVEK